MEESTADDVTLDDPNYWDNIVEELLDIDITPSRERSNWKPSIKIVAPEPVLQDQDCDIQIGGEPGNSGLLLDRPYIFEDCDSEALESGINNEYIPIENSPAMNNQEEPPVREVLDYSSHVHSLEKTSDECKEQTVSLYEIIEQENVEEVIVFIANHKEDIGAISLVSEDNGTSPVTAAAAIGNLNILEKLLDAGVWLSCTDGDGKMAIHRAVENGQNDVVKWLTMHGQLTGMTKDGMLAIHIAANCGQLQAINILLNCDVNVDEETVWGLTPLQLAIENGHVDIAELLIDKGANVNHINRQNTTAIHAPAVQLGQTDLLTNHGGYQTKHSISGKTPLHIAVESNHYQVVSKLLEAGADVDIQDATGHTVLHKLHISDIPMNVMSRMCQKSKDIDLKDSKGRSALFLAVEVGNIDACMVLIQNHAMVNIDIATGCTPLYAATHYGHWDIVDKLILAGANVNKQTDNGSTALYKAAWNGQLHIVALLLCSGAKINLARRTGWTPLHVAVHHGNNTIVEQLVAAGADCLAQDNQGQSPLAIAAYQKRASTVKILLKECSHPDAFYNVAKLGNQEIIKFLKKCNADFDVTNSLFGWSAIHYAAHAGDYNAVVALTANKVDIDVQDHDGNTPLQMAVLHKHARVVEILLRHNSYLSISNRKGEDAMSIAVQTGNMSIVQLLLKHGAMVDEPDSEGKRPLVHAILRGHMTVAMLLISHGASVTLRREDHGVISPIRLVCQHGNAEILKMMAGRGTTMDQRDEHRNTLLHTAVKHGRTDIALELITMRGSLVNAENDFGKKPIHIAALEGHALLVETLLSAGTQVSIMDEDGTVLYEMAKHKEVWDVLRQWAIANPIMLVPAPRDHHHVGH